MASDLLTVPVLDAAHCWSRLRLNATPPIRYLENAGGAQAPPVIILVSSD
ncbi:hypothetical protein HJB61_17190 [Rhizobium lentis]|nr:hypothetical protein [Rhizobium lentis]